MLFFKKQQALRNQINYVKKELIYRLFKILTYYLKTTNRINSFFSKSSKKIYFKLICCYSYRNKSLQRIFKASRIQVRNNNNNAGFFGFHKIT
jgi:hypothetical protein